MTAPLFAADSKDILARMEGRDITRSDLNKFLTTLPPQARALPKAVLEPMALDQLINDQLLTNAANAGKTRESDEFKEREAELMEQLTREIYLSKRIDKRVTNSAIRDEYSRFVKENPAQTEYEARHMLVDSKEKAEGLIKQLDSGADFAKLASQNNSGPEKEKGGALGFFTAKEVVPEFAEAIAKMKPGTVTKTPVQTQFGWHVIQLENSRKREAPKFEEVKEQMRVRVSQRYVQEEIQKLRKDAKVEVFADNLTSMPKSAAPKSEDGQTGKKAN
jgi:peptidyl-prolyl cis-trans isomerase C